MQEQCRLQGEGLSAAVASWQQALHVSLASEDKLGSAHCYEIINLQSFM